VHAVVITQWPLILRKHAHLELIGGRIVGQSEENGVGVDGIDVVCADVLVASR